jgi:allantoin racemase
MRLLLINPNTSADITDTVVRHAEAAVGPEVEIIPATGRFGARYISSRAAAAIAAHAALEAFAEHGKGCDAVYLACFGDPGLLALKELSSVPVVGMAEAACHLACVFGQRFSIVTGGQRWGPMLEEFVAGQGLAARLASVRTVAPTGAEIARNPDEALVSLAEACKACAAEDGAEAVVLGGAALAGLARRIMPQVDIPVLCSVEAGAKAAVALARHPAVKKAETGSLAATPAVETTGLAPSLTRLFSRGLA